MNPAIRNDLQAQANLRTLIQENALHFLQFLYCASTNPDALTLNVDPDAPRVLQSITTWRQHMHRAYIAPTLLAPQSTLPMQFRPKLPPQPHPLTNTTCSPKPPRL
jgi:hypothetical protein